MNEQQMAATRVCPVTNAPVGQDGAWWSYYGFTHTGEARLPA
ncbi:MAG: hypothetical protein QGI10_07110 [Vicinamibacterales bacterium]|nr:hypothetical protein [Vicinamibacterales bacterium]MDP7479022.1 hypothetical protein [Vicinamibacterales bacterium]MDP7693213.1 hypothetical protein [Vicinamibacterales bacterium]HJN44575.1 hypothetical protein [Vicinamibacterales bacterium]